MAVSVPVCAACGRENVAGARFCSECGGALASVPGGWEQRKVVTILFCDVTGSTELGESVDPEALRALLARYFERMKAIVESHGGTVEKFIGDAVMAVFGVPLAHEDDALRAVRAAAEMRAALPELGVQARIGVNTGEVVTGTEERLATGDAVNVAARLEQAAQPGEVLLGAETMRLVRNAVDAEPVEPLELKGKREPVRAFRLVAVREAPERLHGNAFVGRDRELEQIAAAWVRAGIEQRCELLTIVAEAGVGKTRLAAEALSRLDARLVRARCLSYGEGITYWPVVEVVKQLDARPSDPAAAATIAALLGETEAGTSAEEIAWAFRKLLEEQAPLVCLFEDIHWGEETFLDLVEHVALLSAGAQVLVLCTARPELLDRRPSWPVTIRLAPLEPGEVDRLVPAGLPPDLRDRIARTAGGNPLFLTEMVAMAETADGEVSVPPTLRALLTARLDQVDPAERHVLERGAVEGEIFHRGAVQALAPEEQQVTARLAGLVRRELVRPDRAQIPGDDGFRFRHLLIRDAAYEALPKATRAELHERFAAWIEQHGHDLVELDEILGYHLEQAAGYRAELGQPEPRLAERASDRLAVAGRRALSRGDNGAATGLLERALELTRPSRLDVTLEIDLARALEEQPQRAAAVAEAAAERAAARGDDAGAALARFCAALNSAHYETHVDLDELDRLGREAIPLLEAAGNHLGLVHVWAGLAGSVANWRGRNEDQIHAAERAIAQARLAGQPLTHLFGIEAALAYGSRPADEALRTLDALLPETPRPQSLVRRAWLLTMLDRSDEATHLMREAGDRWRELTGDDSVDNVLGHIAATAGDHAAAVTHWRRYCDMVASRGQAGYLSTYAGWLGRELWATGQHDEAERQARICREHGWEQDVATQMLWRELQALVHARRGDHAEAERLAREAVALGEPTEWLIFQGDAYCDLAEVLALAGMVDEARDALEQALDRYERKRCRPAAARVRERLATNA
jgi:class 3 adenylate cyclase/tetratricopeptide (TPR) repeat protein